MLLKNTSTEFGHISILIHWLVALAVYGMFGLGLWMVTLGYYDTWYHRAPELHKSIGCLLFIIMVIRVVWRLISPPPKPLASHSYFIRIMSRLMQFTLYIVLFGILCSGYLISTAEGQPIYVFGWVEIPAIFTGQGMQADMAGIIHLYLAWIVVVLSLLHGLASLKHHFIDHDSTLKRILGFKP
ncbi:cytochrome b [Xenorhabdus szentirmaii]|uniref:Cytochrome b561 homolog 2 n=2 Tax=Xenorhabdus szentirmaii TaxID=290112 RepID=W1J6F2_9GAMM|nr:MULTISPECIES: cytochrome b [Xenorhabdus]MBD2780240.1 cytochrome b [Xenorhabdus sp. 38]MBD2790786.1 cytochrome b [Xenorhabdus sp. CUL]MBD2800097.1 cytochrome b [Xenorhabdus sp. M]MBD2804920.1 cytochrome b [Xenorhabdus sp. ZM]MBD2820624.1 cytochrome b [Xenorhabdus sp. 42]